MLDEHYAPGLRYHWLRAVELIPHWSELRTATTSKTITSLFIFTTIIPLLVKLLENGKKICVAFHVGELCVPLALPFSASILFAAGVCALVATAVYAMRCPPWIKVFRDVRDFHETGMDSTELYEQANRYFDKAYGRDAIPRFFLYCRLMNYDRTIMPLHADLDDNYKALCAMAREPRGHGLPTDGDPGSFLFSYPFIKHYVASTHTGTTNFDGTPRDYAAKEPERFFWRVYRLQDSSRIR